VLTYESHVGVRSRLRDRISIWFSQRARTLVLSPSVVIPPLRRHRILPRRTRGWEVGHVAFVRSPFLKWAGGKRRVVPFIAGALGLFPGTTTLPARRQTPDSSENGADRVRDPEAGCTDGPTRAGDPPVRRTGNAPVRLTGDSPVRWTGDSSGPWAAPAWSTNDLSGSQESPVRSVGDRSHTLESLEWPTKTSADQRSPLDRAMSAAAHARVTLGSATNGA